MMRTYFAILIICSCGVSCVAQRTTEREEGERNNCLQTLERRINTYADSLNFWKKGSKLPEFVLNPLFDQGFYYTNDCLREGKPFSYRKLIIDRVLNEEALQYILQLRDEKLDEVFVPTEEQMSGTGLVMQDFYRNFPYRTHSTRYLVEKRIERIHRLKEEFYRHVSNAPK
jgi:hypothetical protein